MIEAIAWTLTGPPYYGTQSFLSRWHIRDVPRPAMTACGVRIPDKLIMMQQRDPGELLRDPRICATCANKIRQEARA